MGMDRFAPVTGAPLGSMASPQGVLPGMFGVLDRARAGSSLKNRKSDTPPLSRVGVSRGADPLSCAGGKPYRCQKCLACLRSQAKVEQALIGLVVDATANSWFVTRTISDVGLRRIKAALSAAGLEDTPRNIDRVFRKMVISPALKRLRSVLARRYGHAVKLHAWSKSELGGRTNRFHVHMVLSCDEVVTKEQIKSALMGKGADGTLRGFGGFTDCRALKSLRPAVQARLVRLGRADGKGVATYLAGYVNKQLGVFRPYRSDHYGQIAVDRFADVEFLADEFASVFRSDVGPDYPVLRASGRYIPRKLAKPLWRRVHRLAYEAFNGPGSFSVVEAWEASVREANAQFRQRMRSLIAAHDRKYPPTEKGLDVAKLERNPAVRVVALMRSKVGQEVPEGGVLPPAVLALDAVNMLRGERIQFDGISGRLSAALAADDPEGYEAAWAEFTRFRSRSFGIDYAGAGLRPSGMSDEDWQAVKPGLSAQAAPDAEKSARWSSRFPNGPWTSDVPVVPAVAYDGPRKVSPVPPPVRQLALPCKCPAHVKAASEITNSAGQHLYRLPPVPDYSAPPCDYDKALRDMRFVAAAQSTGDPDGS